MTDDAPTAADQTIARVLPTASDYRSGIRLMRGGLTPYVGISHSIKHEGWRRWRVLVMLDGSTGMHWFGPFTSKGKARQVRAAIIELHRSMDYHYRYKIREQKKS